MVEQEVCALCLTRTTFAADHDALEGQRGFSINTVLIFITLASHLIPLLLQHRVVRVIGDREYVRRQNGSNALILVQADILGIVDRMKLEGVHRNQNAPHISVNVAGIEALSQVLQQRGLVKVRQLAQVRVLSVFGLKQKGHTVAQELWV